MEKQIFIYRVAFVAPPLDGDDRTAFYFSSVAAIYELFNPSVLGVALKTLWKKKLADGNPFNGPLCSITREVLYRKAKQNTGYPKTGSQSLDSSSDV